MSEGNFNAGGFSIDANHISSNTHNVPLKREKPSRLRRTDVSHSCSAKAPKLKVVDVFPFFNELDLVKLRLETVKSVVDDFVIIEAPMTFSGKPKPLYFTDNAHLFAEYAERISLIVVDLPVHASPFEREWHQMNFVKSHLTFNYDPNDLILWGDVDEIPHPLAVKTAISATENFEIAHFAQRMFYYFLNCEDTRHRLLSYAGDYQGIKRSERRWLGTKAIRLGDIGDQTMIELRHPRKKEGGVRIRDGGWHFSFCGGTGASVGLDQRVRDKVNAYAHQELNTAKFSNNLSDKLRKNKDLFGRRGTKFTVVPLDSTFPFPLIQNRSSYQHMLVMT